MNYSLKVDVWAMGVVTYGLLCGRFPFRNEAEANKKQLSFSPDVPPDAQDLAQSMLAKTEEKRGSSDSVYNHPFLLKYKPVDEPKAAPAQAPSAEGESDEVLIREFGADCGVKDRRFELVERLMNAGTKMSKAASTTVESSKSKAAGGSHYWNENFSISDKRANDVSIRYEWWSPDKINNDLEGIPEGGGVTKLETAGNVNAEAENKASETVIKKQLEDHGINTGAFGKGEAKTLKQLAAEVQSGAAVLMLDATEHKKLVRVVDVVALRICAPDGKILIETGEQFSDGRKRSTNRLPGTKKDPHENTKQVAERIVADYLDLGGSKVSFEYDIKEVFEESDMSPSYPGVCTVYRKQFVQGQLKPAGARCSSYTTEGDAFLKKDNTGNTKFFRWMEPAQCENEHIQYKKPAEDDESSALVQAPIGLNEEDLTTYLEKYKVDITKFGKDNAKTLMEFSSELLQGESSLCHGTDGSIIRVVDIVLLKIKNGENGKILVQAKQTYPDGKEVVLNRLPGTKRRPDENQFVSARRIVKRQVMINDNHLTCDAGNVQAVEEEKPSLAYPGLRTVYRKRIVSATLTKD